MIYITASLEHAPLKSCKCVASISILNLKPKPSVSLVAETGTTIREDWDGNEQW